MRRGKRGEGWRRHSKLGSLLFLRVLRQTQLAASHCNDYPATKSFHSPPKNEEKIHTFHLCRCPTLYITQDIVRHVAHIYFTAMSEIPPTTTYEHTCLRWCIKNTLCLQQSVDVSHEANLYCNTENTDPFSEAKRH